MKTQLLSIKLIIITILSALIILEIIAIDIDAMIIKIVLQ